MTGLFLETGNLPRSVLDDFIFVHTQAQLESWHFSKPLERVLVVDLRPILIMFTHGDLKPVLTKILMRANRMAKERGLVVELTLSENVTDGTPVGPQIRFTRTDDDEMMVFKALEQRVLAAALNQRLLAAHGLAEPNQTVIVDFSDAFQWFEFVDRQTILKAFLNNSFHPNATVELEVIQPDPKTGTGTTLLCKAQL